MTSFLETHHRLDPKQFDFRNDRSAAELLLLQSATWNKVLDSGSEVFVVVLDIVGGFDRVYRQDITTKLISLFVCDDLVLLGGYQHDRTLYTMVSGDTSIHYPNKASVPQGSVLGPLP